MIASSPANMNPPRTRIVITGVGITAPNGNDLAELRDSLLNCRSGVSAYEIRYFGKTHAGICNFDPLKYQVRRDVRRELRRARSLLPRPYRRSGRRRGRSTGEHVQTLRQRAPRHTGRRSRMVVQDGHPLGSRSTSRREQPETSAGTAPRAGLPFSMACLESSAIS